MSMVRLIYVSRMTEACDMAALQEILAVSRKNNALRDITGMLCYDPLFFMQCLEGPREAVNELYRDIARDNRHTQVTLLEYQEIRERMFDGWSMAFVRASELDEQVLRDVGTPGKLDPFALSPDQAKVLVAEIVKQKSKHFS